MKGQEDEEREARSIKIRARVLRIDGLRSQIKHEKNPEKKKELQQRLWVLVHGVDDNPIHRMMAEHGITPNVAKKKFVPKPMSKEEKEWDMGEVEERQIHFWKIIEEQLNKIFDKLDRIEELVSHGKKENRTHKIQR